MIMITIRCKTCGEETKLYSTKDAAEYLGPFFGWTNPTASFKYHVYEARSIKGQLVGHSLFFTKEQLDRFAAVKRPQGRPRKEVST